MALHIRSEEAHRLARELADLTGETMTAAVIEALRQQIERVRRERRGGLAERLMAIAEETAPLFKEPWKSMDHGDLLYDELGLPKGWERPHLPPQETDGGRMETKDEQ